MLRPNALLSTFAIAFAQIALAEESTPSVTEPTDVLTLADATALTLAYSPRLESVYWEARIQEAAAIQAAARPNPELALDVENALGNGEFNDFDAAEETLSIGQTIELGRKRRRRMDVAAQDIQVANHGQIVRRTEVLNAMTKAFYEAVAAQQESLFAEKTLKMHQQLSSSQAERLAAGKISESEVENGKATLALAEIEAHSERSRLEQSLRALSAHWSNSVPKFNRVNGSLATGSLPEEQTLREGMQENSILGYASKIIDRQQASVDLEMANRIPDITAGIGSRRFKANGDEAMVFQVSIPIPLFDRNRGNLERARAELGKARAERANAAAMLEASFTASYQQCSTAFREAKAIAASVLPSAERAYQFANEGYHLGKFSYLEIKTAQATLIESRKKLVSSQLRFHTAKADLDALAGRTQ